MSLHLLICTIWILVAMSGGFPWRQNDDTEHSTVPGTLGGLSFSFSQTLLHLVVSQGLPSQWWRRNHGTLLLVSNSCYIHWKMNPSEALCFICMKDWSSPSWSPSILLKWHWGIQDRWTSIGLDIVSRRLKIHKELRLSHWEVNRITGLWDSLRPEKGEEQI